MKIRKKKSVNRDVLSLARERVREAFKLFDTVAVSFSGGKDSTAVLNLTLEAARELGRTPLPVFFFDEEAIVPETVEYCERVRAIPDIDFTWLCVPARQRNACSLKHPFWWPWAPEDRDRWVRPLPGDVVTHLDGFPEKPKDRPPIPGAVGYMFKASEYGRVGMMMGIRGQESLTRLRAVLMTTKDSRPYIRQFGAERNRKNLFKVYPIYDWTTEDVWTAPAEFGWDYNRAYDAMDKCGFPPHTQRVCPPFGEEPLRSLWYYQQAAPELWDQMCRRVPGAATAARYSRTSLYSFGGVPDKPKGMTWREFIKYHVDKHPDEVRGEVARRVYNHVRTHFKKTKDPLAVNNIHPLTGVSWKFLLNIAIRGDFKGRRQNNALPSMYESNKRRYDKEIAEMNSRGEL